MTPMIGPTMSPTWLLVSLLGFWTSSGRGVWRTARRGVKGSMSMLAAELRSSCGIEGLEEDENEAGRQIGEARQEGVKAGSSLEVTRLSGAAVGLSRVQLTFDFRLAWK